MYINKGCELMISGIGVDTIELYRIEKLINRNKRFVNRILTLDELSLYENLKGRRKVEFLAGRFAAKEAISKALGSGIGKHFSWHSVSILQKKSGAPHIVWNHNRCPKNVHISITHSDTLAIAYVIIEEKK